jgi:hypothetical protein
MTSFTTSSHSHEEIEVYFRRLDGVPEPRRAGPGLSPASPESSRSIPSPSQCPVFMDGATYGFELRYPFSNECRISLQNGTPHIECDFGEAPWNNIPWPPVRWVNPEHYSVMTCVDLAPPPGYILRVEPHSRYFNDRTGNVPAAVIGNIDAAHWPMYIFLTFKAPIADQVHVLRKGDPLAQMICVPRDARYHLIEMNAVAQNLREELARTLIQNRSELATRSWTSSLGHRFDNLYRLVKAAAEK